MNDEYTEKLSARKGTSDKVMYQLCWSVDELTRLTHEGRALYVKITSLIEILSDDQRDQVQDNVARRITEVQSRLVNYLHSWGHKASASCCYTHTCHDDQSI